MSGRPVESYLARNSKIESNRLKKRLFAAGLLEARCGRCGRTEWEGQPIPLDLEHVNGDPQDNRLENLMVLCANCHRLTPTHSVRKVPPAVAIRCECGCPKSRGAVHCKNCTIRPTKIRWPDVVTLREAVRTSSAEATARRLGVSGAAVRERLRTHAAVGEMAVPVTPSR